MSSIAAGTTGTTGLVHTSDTTGALVLKTNGTTTALTLDTSQNATFVGYTLAPKAGFSSVKGQTGANNSGTPNTQYDFAADAVTLADANFTVLTKGSTGTVTNNVSTSGPAANGRDQSGAFSSSSWVHFYWIYNPATDTLATLSSASATSPTLPSGYTHWAYIGAVYFNGSSQLIKTYIRGSHAFYQTSVTVAAITNSATENTQSLAAVIPSNAITFTMQGTCGINPNTLNGTTQYLQVRLVTGVTFAYGGFSQGGADTGANALQFTFPEVPNVGNSIILYQTYSNNSGTVTGTFTCVGYRVPNGGE